MDRFSLILWCFLLLVPKKPLLSKEEWDRLSSILDGCGQVLFAAVVVPFVFNITQTPFLTAIVSSEFTFVFWFGSMMVARKVSQL